MALIYPDIVRALFTLTGPGVLTGKGATSTTHHAAGDNTITLEQALDAAACIMIPGAVGAPAANTGWATTVVQTSDAAKRISYWLQSFAAGPPPTIALNDTPTFAWAVFALPS